MARLLRIHNLLTALVSVILLLLDGVTAVAPPATRLTAAQVEDTCTKYPSVCTGVAQINYITELVGCRLALDCAPDLQRCIRGAVLTALADPRIEETASPHFYGNEEHYTTGLQIGLTIDKSLSVVDRWKTGIQQCRLIYEPPADAVTV
jgi:hypothetical protein